MFESRFFMDGVTSCSKFFQGRFRRMAQPRLHRMPKARSAVVPGSGTAAPLMVSVVENVLLRFMPLESTAPVESRIKPLSCPPEACDFNKARMAAAVDE